MSSCGQSLPSALVKWVDGHLDLAYLAVNGRDLRADVADPQTGCVSLPALRTAGIEIALGTIFTEPGDASSTQPHMYDRNDPSSAERAGLLQLEQYEQWERENDISIVRTRDDLNRDAPLPKIVILMEGADPIRLPDHARMWFERGLRIVGLTWATGTRYAGGNSSAPAPGSGPLTGLGIEMVAALDELGIIHDVSHLSDAAFDGLLRHARPEAPILASHSNCRALVEGKQRHLRDDQIKVIADRGGIIGLNLYSNFLFPRPGPGRPGGRRATIADCVAHLEHISRIAGNRSHVALGSDMDGGFGPEHLPVGLDHPRKLATLIDALREANWTEDEIEGFAHENWIRFLRTHF